MEKKLKNDIKVFNFVDMKDLIIMVKLVYKLI